MTKIRLECEFKVLWGSDDHRELDELLDRVVGHLAELDAGRVAVASDAGDSSFLIAMVLGCQPPENPEETFMRGMSLVRTAFHVNDVSTANWPTFELAGGRFKPVKDCAEVDQGERDLAMA